MGFEAIADPALVVPTIARALGIRETSGHSLDEILRRFLHGRKLLLVLDNFEHLLDSAPQVSGLVRDASSVKVLHSSRAPLRIAGEREYPVPELADRDAVALFTERAQAIKPDFQLDGDTAAVAEICRRLDGLPLAIELAAARAKVLSPAALLQRLDRRLPVLTGGARDLPDRQRTLRDTIAWSYELLDDHEQKLFARLGVFVGGFTLTAAEDVCDAELDVLASLVEKSLLRRGDERFGMLETIREYAFERLDKSGEPDEARRRHLDFFLEFVERERSLAVTQAPGWVERLESEHDNFRAALQYARELDDPRLESQLVAALANFWEFRGYLTEGLERVRGTLELDPEAPAQLRGRLLVSGGVIARKQGDYEAAVRMAAELDELCAATGDATFAGEALNLSGIIASAEGRYGEARDLLERAKSIRMQLGDEPALQSSVHNLAVLAMQQGDYARARTELELALALAEKNALEWQICNTSGDLGFAELGDGRLEQARARFEASLDSAFRIGWRENVAHSLVGLASLDVAAGNLDCAGHLLGQAELIVEDAHLTFEIHAERERIRVERELRSLLGQARLEALRAEGRSLPIDVAVSDALRADEDVAPSRGAT